MLIRQLVEGDFSAKAIDRYNSSRRGPRFNGAYARFMSSRAAGIRDGGGSVQAWMGTENAARNIWKLLDCYGMNARASVLMPIEHLRTTLGSLARDVSIDEVAVYRIPTGGLGRVLPCGVALARALRTAFDYLRVAQRVSEAGGFVVASKVFHCLLPDLAPMLDRTHIALSLYRIDRDDYFPPGGSWSAYLGSPPPRTPNPSPQGAGSEAWQADQFLCAIGVYERIYEEWQRRHNQPGLAAFLALDGAPGTGGVPRVVDKILWEQPA